MNVRNAWLCLSCEEIHPDSKKCPVCGETHVVPMAATPLGTLGEGRVLNVQRNKPRPFGQPVFIPGRRYQNKDGWPASHVSQVILPEVIREAVRIERRAAGHWVRP